MNRIRRLWRGDVALPNAFWDWAVIGGLLVNAVTSALALVLIMADRPVLALIVGYGFAVPYNVVVCVGVWRSADRYAGERRWADLARIVTIMGMIVLSAT